MWDVRMSVPAPPPWMRGRAAIEGDDIVLDPDAAETYQPLPGRGLASDLAKIRSPSEALPFVRKHGLLWHGPDSDEFREPWADWESVARHLSVIFQMYLDLQDAREGDPRAIDLLRERWSDALAATFVGGVDPSDDGLLMQTARAIGMLVSAGLDHTEIGIDAAAYYESEDGKRLGGLSDFVYVIQPPNLLGYVYFDVMQMLTLSERARRCEECGRVFVVVDRRQRFCSKQCAGRARYRRWAEKKGGSE